MMTDKEIGLVLESLLEATIVATVPEGAAFEGLIGSTAVAALDEIGAGDLSNHLTFEVEVDGIEKSSGKALIRVGVTAKDIAGAALAAASQETINKAMAAFLNGLGERRLIGVKLDPEELPSSSKAMEKYFEMEFGGLEEEINDSDPESGV